MVKKNHTPRKRNPATGNRTKSFIELSRNEIGMQLKRTMTHVKDEMLELEKDTAKKIEEVVEERYLLIRQSREFPVVCRLILSGAKAVEIAKYLKEEDTDRFANVAERALARQVSRFSNEIMTHFKAQADDGARPSVPITQLDLIAEKFVNRVFDPLTLIERSILAQEVRLDAALENERKLPFVQSAVGDEIERLTRICSSYLTLRKLLGLAPDKFADAMSSRSVRVMEIKNTFINLPVEKRKELLNLVKYAGTISPTTPEAQSRGEGDSPVPDPQPRGA